MTHKYHDVDIYTSDAIFNDIVLPVIIYIMPCWFTNIANMYISYIESLFKEVAFMVSDNHKNACDGILLVDINLFSLQQLNLKLSLDFCHIVANFDASHRIRTFFCHVHE